MQSGGIKLLVITEIVVTNCFNNNVHQGLQVYSDWGMEKPVGTTHNSCGLVCAI